MGMVVTPSRFTSGLGPVDIYVDNVISLCRFGDGNGVTTCADQVPARMWQRIRYPVQTTTPSLFGSSVLSCDGGWYTAAHSDDMYLGTSDWTMECWCYLTTASNGYRGIWSKRYNASNDNSWAFGTDSTTGFLFQWGNSTGNSSIGLVRWDYTFPLNSWHFVALVRTGGAINLYIDGLLVTPTSGSTAIGSTIIYNNPGYPLEMGQMSGGSSGAMGVWQGCLTQYRITVGVARYIANFTPPSAAFPYR